MLYGGRDHGQLENLWLGHIGCGRREYDAIKKKKEKTKRREFRFRDAFAVNDFSQQNNFHASFIDLQASRVWRTHQVPV